ncbi:glycosyltransferase family 2 protein [Bacteroidales bacterium OttesenSCG-928-J19]|nr:glycosyltransferase family 2 protein [Bacteroidales bacterium OttesenSCG-928-J19]
MYSICIPVYNFDVRPLVSDLSKLSEESGLNYEILLIDDASDPEFRRLNSAIDLPHVSYIQLSNNIGRSKIRNQLADTARYPYLIFMDCDSALPSEDYIRNYVPLFIPGIVCYGGRIYHEEKPDKQFILRWKYGVKRESVPAEKRSFSPNYGFETNNFLIDKLVFNEVRFEESITDYGHEDTLFGIELMKHNRQIVHIDNPLLHIGLEDALCFLEKTESSTRNLQKVDKLLQAKYPQQIHYSRLVTSEAKIKRIGLTPLFRQVFRMLQPCIKRNLLSSNPSLFLFDIYRLGLYTSIK